MKAEEREIMEKKQEQIRKDEMYMKRAIELARKGEGWVSPNPLVGAVIVKDDRIIGEGYHEKYGQAHAERNALLKCTDSPKGATIYVTLEPCCHHGKQPPCTDAILEAGIKRVVIGSMDPNPLVGGKGADILRKNGIEVEIMEGTLVKECRDMNRVFFHYIQTGCPYITMKYAMTMDGKIAAASGKSKWITGEAAREHVQTQRHRNRGIMVGIGTVLQDDPMLDCRMENGRNPIRIICDSKLRIPLNSKIVNTSKEIPTYLVTSVQEKERWKAYEEAGCHILYVPGDKRGIDLKALMVLLGKEGIDSILLEGGEELNGSFLSQDLVDFVQVYLAPKLFGGKEAKSPVGGEGILDPIDCKKLKESRITLLGNDILIESEVEKNVHRNC